MGNMKIVIVDGFIGRSIRHDETATSAKFCTPILIKNVGVLLSILTQRKQASSGIYGFVQVRHVHRHMKFLSWSMIVLPCDKLLQIQSKDSITHYLTVLYITHFFTPTFPIRINTKYTGRIIKNSRVNHVFFGYFIFKDM